jgi:hypothetical protein
VAPARNCLESDETVSRNKKSEGRDTVMSQPDLPEAELLLRAVKL